MPPIGVSGYRSRYAPNQSFGGDDGTGGYAPLAVAVGSGGVLNWVHGNHLGVPLVTTGDDRGLALRLPADQQSRKLAAATATPGTCERPR